MVRQQKPGMSAEQLKDILSRRGEDPEINLLLREISYMRRILRETDQFLVMIDDMPWHDERKKRMYEGLSIAVRQHKAVKEWRRQQKTISELTQVHQQS